MKRQLALLLVAALLALPASAARRRSAAPVAGDTLSIVFVDAGAGGDGLTAAGEEAWLDVNNVAHPVGGRGHVTRVSRRFGVRVVPTNGVATSGAVTIKARLQSSDGRTTMRLDGKLLTEAPAIVDFHAAIGAVAVHVLDIEINDSVAPGPIAAAISWEIVAQ